MTLFSPLITRPSPVRVAAGDVCGDSLQSLVGSGPAMYLEHGPLYT